MPSPSPIFSSRPAPPPASHCTATGNQQQAPARQAPPSSRREQATVDSILRIALTNYCAGAEFAPGTSARAPAPFGGTVIDGLRWADTSKMGSTRPYEELALHPERYDNAVIDFCKTNGQDFLAILDGPRHLDTASAKGAHRRVCPGPIDRLVFVNGGRDGFIDILQQASNGDPEADSRIRSATTSFYTPLSRSGYAFDLLTYDQRALIHVDFLPANERTTIDPRAPLVVLLPGNANLGCDCIEEAAQYSRWGYNCLLPTRRGEGRSFGLGEDPIRPNELDTVLDAQRVLDVAYRMFPHASRRVLHGKSLGGHVASALASTPANRISLLVLDQTFDTMGHVAKNIAFQPGRANAIARVAQWGLRLLSGTTASLRTAKLFGLPYRNTQFNTMAYMKKIRSQRDVQGQPIDVVAFHSKDDDMMSEDMSEKLIQTAYGSDTAAASHRRIINGDHCCNPFGNENEINRAWFEKRFIRGDLHVRPDTGLRTAPSPRR